MRKRVNTKRICLLASSVMGIFSNIFVSFAPVSAALGLTYEAICELHIDRYSLEKQFHENVQDTIEALSGTLLKHSQREILNVLLYDVDLSCNLTDVIEKTEEFQKLYCTKKDVMEIVEEFDKAFLINMVDKPELCRFYSLCNQKVTIDTLKKLDDITSENAKKLDKIEDSVSRTNKFIENTTNTIKMIFSNLSYIVIQIGIFLVLGLFLFPDRNRELLLVVAICFTSSCLSSNALSFKFCNVSMLKNTKKFFAYFIIRSMITISVFLLVSYLINAININQIGLPIVCLVISEYLGLIFSLLNSKYHWIGKNEDM